MGSKSPQTSTTVSTPPPQVLAQYQKVVDQANQVAQTPYQAYGGPLVSPIDVQQGMGITGVNAYSNQAQPQLQEANRLTQQGSTAVNPTAFSGSQVGQYMSPYQSQVINATEAELANQDAQQQQQLQGNAIGAGAFGGDRAGVAQGILAGQQSLANNSTIANLNNQNYTQGLGEFNTQQSTNLAAQQANQARLQSAGAQIGNIGTASQTAGLQGAAAQVQAGTLEQQTQQAQDTAAYNQFLQQQAYPFQTTQWLSNISEGIGSNSGGTSTTTQPGPNPLNSIIGGGLGLLGLFSDKRLKENISPVGKTFDGQTIYRYNFKGSPRTEVGLIAQEVEKKHPEAVGRVGGLRMVDYGQATEDSAKRKHFASGGDVIPYADNAINELTWIPQTQAMMGPGPPKSGAPINNGQGQMDQSISQGFKQLGSGLQNSSIGDSISDFMQDSFGLARGGIVPRRGYDIGGTPFQGIVTPVMMGASGTTGVGGAVNGSNAKGDNDADDKPQPITPIIHGGGDGPGAPAGSSGGDGGGMMRGGLVMRRRRPHFDDGGDVLDPTPSPVQMPGTVSDADLALAAAVQMPGMVSDNDLALAAARQNANASEWTSSSPPAWSPGGSTPAQTSPRDTSELGASIQEKLLESAVNGSQGGMTLPAAAQGVSQGIANGMYLPGNGPDGGILPPAAQSGGSSIMGPQPLHPINDGTMGGEQAASRGLFGPAPVWARATGNADGSPPPPVAGDPAADAAQWNEAQAAARARAAASGKPFYQGSGEHDYTGAADAGPVQPINNGTPSSAGDTQADAVWFRMLRQESGGQQFNADGSVKTSPKGAIGIAQIMPSTGPEAAKLAGLAWDPVKFANDPAYNVALGHALYNKQLQDFGTPALAAAAYNAGPTALAAAQTKAATKGGSWLSYLPSETQNYVAAVTGGSPASAAIDKAAGAPQGGLTTGAPQGGLLPSDGSAMTPPTGVANAAKTLGSTVSNGSLLPLGLSDAARSALMSAGFGMMASKSRNLGQAIGEGGLQGISTYRDMAKLGQEAGLNQAQIANLQSEAAYRPASLTLESQKLQLQIAALQRQLKAGDILGGIDTGTSSGPISVSPAPTPINGANAPIPIPSRASGANPPPVVASTGNPASLGVGTTGNAAPVSSSAPSGANTLPPANSDFWQGVPALENPAILNDRAARVAALNPELAGQLMTKAQAIVNRGTVLKNGQLVPIPGYVDTQAAVEGAKAGASEAAKAPYEMVEVQPEAGGATQLVPKSSLLGGNGPKGTVVGPGAGSPPGSTIDAAANANPIIKSQPAFYAERQKAIAADEATMMDQFRSRQLSKQRLQALASIMQTYQPGAFAEQKANLVANLRAAGFNVPATATANPVAFQEFTKNAIANVFNDVKGMGGRVLVSEIQGLSKTNANAQLQPEAAAGIIGQALGAIDYEDQHTQDYFNWKKQNPNATQTADFELPWAQSHPVSQYVAQANKGIAYQGQSIPPATQRTSGQTYMTPKGPMVWRGTGWASP